MVSNLLFYRSQFRREAKFMNEDVLTGHWKDMRGTLKTWWGNLTDDDFEWIGGQKDRLIGLLQQKYGYTRDQALNEVDRRLGECGTAFSSIIKEAGTKVYELGQNVADKARAAQAEVSNKMEKATSYWQEKEFRAMADDVAGLVRRHPIPSLLIALGIGYALARSAFSRDTD
jgi:uncharacterized protein YjbJ (UPF0337 family)